VPERSSAHPRHDPPSGRVSRRLWRRVGAIGLLAITLTACSAEELPRLGMPEPVTNQGPRILLLWQTSWFAAFAIGAVVWGLIIVAVIRYRRRHADDPLPRQTRYNVPIEVFYTVVPLVIVGVLFYYTARDEAEITRIDPNPDVHIGVHAFQWSWQFTYADAGVSTAGTPGDPPTLVLPRGELVEFELTSSDVIHSFWVPAFLYKMDVIPGRTNVFQVVPTETGTYAGKCAEMCGEDHARMLFNVRIVEPAEYESYLAGLQAEAAQ